MRQIEHIQLDINDLFTLNPSPKKANNASNKAISHQSQHGQFMTPPSIARFMAGLFSGNMPPTVRLLEAGAGRAALTSAFVERWAAAISAGLEAHAYEYDQTVIGALREVLRTCEEAHGVSTSLFDGDFIEMAATMIRLQRGPRYSHAILNPPYKKINSASKHRKCLRAIGLETVNLYTGFLGLVIDLLEPRGEVVAIIPRSFCNGPYYKPFRAFMAKRVAIRHIHLFESRNKAFRADDVLQENVIIHLKRDAPQGSIMISTSTDGAFSNYKESQYEFDQIVFSDDSEQFIHIPTQGMAADFENLGIFRFGLRELGIGVSTGPVVDFRLRDWLRQMPEQGTVPLLYPGHFSAAGLEWPLASLKKPNAIKRTLDTEKWLYPSGFYTVVRRFSSKEEKRRIVASVVDPAGLPGSALGFENHLNVFHQGRQPLPELLARGLSVFLNGTGADQHFRRFNGHTQVNATDLKQMKYPDRDGLISLGKWAKDNPDMTQDMIDQEIRSHA